MHCEVRSFEAKEATKDLHRKILNQWGNLRKVEHHYGTVQGMELQNCRNIPKNRDKKEENLNY